MKIKTIIDKKGFEHYIREESVELPKKKDSFTIIPQKWWRGELKGLKCIERCLLISLRVWNQIRPSKSQLARELGVSRNSVVKYLKKLKEKGFL